MRTSFSEEELYAAAEEAQEYLLSLLPSEDSCPPHEFSRAFTAKVEGIYKQLRACTLPHKRPLWAGLIMFGAPQRYCFCVLF